MQPSTALAQELDDLFEGLFRPRALCARFAGAFPVIDSTPRCEICDHQVFDLRIVFRIQEQLDKLSGSQKGSGYPRCETAHPWQQRIGVVLGRVESQDRPYLWV